MCLAEFLQDQGLAGGRKAQKRAVDSDDDEEDEDSGSDGSITLGLEDTPVMNKKSAKLATVEPPASTPGPSSKSSDAEFIAHMMDKMQLTGSESRGWNLDCSHPYFWWSYSYQGSRFVRVELLCWGSTPGACMPKLSPDGKMFYFSQKIPSRFYNMFRQFSYYNGELGPDEATCPDAVYHEGLNASQAMQEAFNMEDMKPLVRVKLPFIVKQDFEDPYRPDALGYQLTSFPHESDQNVPFHVFSVCMKESAAPRKKATPQHQAYANWQMPPAGAAAGMNP